MRGTDISDFKRSYRTRNEGEFPQSMVIHLIKSSDKKYGENPNQHAATYKINDMNEVATFRINVDINSVRNDDKGKGGLSLTNELDITRAMDNLKFFEKETAVIMKHNIVSGFATQANKESLDELFRKARDSDLRSNFGGTFVTNKPLNKETAEAMYEKKGQSPFFVDVVAAPSFEEGVIGYLQEQSKNIRIAEFSGLENLPKFKRDDTFGLYSLKEMPGGRIGVQDLYLTSIKSKEDLIMDPMVIDKENKKHIIQRDPTEREIKDLITSWYLNISGARSNGIVFVKNGTLVAMGSGQVERVGAIEQAIIKGMQKAMDREDILYDPLRGIQGYENLSKNPFKGAVCSSDAFFPFSDSIDVLASVGVSAVIQPYGSIKDSEVIDAANEYKMAMPATLERCFGHF